MTKIMNYILKKRFLIIIITILITLFLISKIKSLTVVVNTNEILPQNHPFVVTENLIENKFGNKHMVIIGLTAKTGDIFQTNILQKVKSVSDQLLENPNIVNRNVTSISTRKSKSIIGNSDGMTVTRLMDKVPTNPEELEKLKQALLSNEVFKGTLISEDLKTTQISAEFKEPKKGMKEIDKIVRDIISKESDANVEFNVGGRPIFQALLEKFSGRMVILFPLAILLIGLIHYEAFRSWQSLFLPLVTAILAVIWSLGILAISGKEMDVFNVVTPILILAIAAGHAVQILKRYYEEYSEIGIKFPQIMPDKRNFMAVQQSLIKIAPVMLIAGLIAALGFFSLIIFDIKSISTFGVFTAAGIVCALILEITFIPAIRSLLPAPKSKELNRENSNTIWSKLIDIFFNWSFYKSKNIFAFFLIILFIFLIGITKVEVENDLRGYFLDDVEQKIDDNKLNQQLAGTNTFQILIDAKDTDGIKDPAVINGIIKLQGFIESQPNVGKTLSIADYLKIMHKAVSGNEYTITDSGITRELIAQYLFLYSNSGEPGDFDHIVDNDYQRGLIKVFLKTGSNKFTSDLINKIKDKSNEFFSGKAEVNFGGGVLASVAVTEIMVKEKILNIIQILAVIFIISSLVFRSLLAGALILVPLIAVTITNFGLMGWAGIPLQSATAFVSAMAIGIGADYGIYLTYRLREELAKSDGNTQLALLKAFRSAGKATLFVSSAVAGGFSVLMFSHGYIAHFWLGLLVVISMLVSAVTALTVFPATIFKYRPDFIFKSEKNKGYDNA